MDFAIYYLYRHSAQIHTHLLVYCVYCLYIEDRESANEPRHGIRYHSITHNDALNQCKRLVIQYTLKRNRYAETKRNENKKT